MPLRSYLRTLFVACLGAELDGQPSVSICGGHPDGSRELPFCEFESGNLAPGRVKKFQTRRGWHWLTSISNRGTIISTHRFTVARMLAALRFRGAHPPSLGNLQKDAPIFGFHFFRNTHAVGGVLTVCFCLQHRRLQSPPRPFGCMKLFDRNSVSKVPEDVIE